MNGIFDRATEAHEEGIRSDSSSSEEIWCRVGSAKNRRVRQLRSILTTISGSAKVGAGGRFIETRKHTCGSVVHAASMRIHKVN